MPRPVRAARRADRRRRRPDRLRATAGGIPARGAHEPRRAPTGPSASPAASCTSTPMPCGSSRWLQLVLPAAGRPGGQDAARGDLPSPPFRSLAATAWRRAARTPAPDWPLPSSGSGPMRRPCSRRSSARHAWSRPASCRNRSRRCGPGGWSASPAPRGGAPARAGWLRAPAADGRTRRTDEFAWLHGRVHDGVRLRGGRDVVAARLRPARRRSGRPWPRSPIRRSRPSAWSTWG